MTAPAGPPELSRDEALAKLRDGYRLRVRVLTGGRSFAFVQSPQGGTNHTHVVPEAVARALIADGTVTHTRTTKHGSDVYVLATP